MITAILHGVIALAQFAATTVFFVRSKKIKEINCLPKAMMVMATASSCYHCVGYSLIYLENNQDALFYITPAFKIMLIVNYGLFFRFVRV